MNVRWVNVWGVAGGWETRCGFVQSFGVRGVAGVIGRGGLRVV